jgi:hypothetical protein
MAIAAFRRSRAISGAIAMTKKAASKKKPARRKAHKRELINTGRDKRYVRRDDQGQFKEVDEMGRSLSQDRRRKAKTVVKAGQGDRGDRRRAS